MSILLVIDHLGSGGSQRQLVNLALGLHSKGHEVSIFVYHPKIDFFEKECRAQNLNLIKSEPGLFGKLNTLFDLYRTIRSIEPKAIISFLDTPNVLVELVGMLQRLLWVKSRPKLIISERSSRKNETSFVKSLLLRLFHGLADIVVCNSYTHAAYLRKFFWISSKVQVIYNGLLEKNFHRAFGKEQNNDTYLVVGRISEEKNVINILRAISILKDRYNLRINVEFAGRSQFDEPSSKYFELLDQYVNVSNINSQVHWLGEVENMHLIYRNYKAVIHASFYEGLPNVICEAISSSVPVLASNVCDNPHLLRFSQERFLFRPECSMDIARSILEFENLDTKSLAEIRTRGFEAACSMLRNEAMIEAFETLLFEPNVASQII